MNNKNNVTQDYKWDLSVFYDGLEDPKFHEDLKRIDNYLDNVAQISARYAELVDDELLLESIKMLEGFSDVSDNVFSFLSLSSSADTNESKYASYLNQIRMKLSPLSVLSVQLSNALHNLGDDLNRFITDNGLEHYRFILEEEARQASFNLEEKEEALLSKLNISGGGAWSRMVSFLTSTLEVDYQDETLTLSEIRNLASDPNRDVRRAAYEAELKSYEKIKDAIAFALNSIKLQVNTLCRERGFENALDQALIASRLDLATLNSMMDEMRASFPSFRRYFKAKAKYIGASDTLAFYDLFAPVGKIDKKFTVEEAGEYLVKSFAEISEDISNVIKRAYDENWIDFLPRKGKVGGAFCSNQAQIKQSRILTNFDGSFGAVNTLAHELGHAYHGYCIENHEPLNRSYTMPVAETASTFNEIHMAYLAIEKSGSAEEKLAVLEELLSGAAQTIVDISSRFLFEDAVFQLVDKEFLDADRLEEIMLDAQDQTYGEALALDSRHPFMWVCKSHYYSTGLSYYNFPYAFGTLFSMGLYAQYKKEGKAFMDQYKSMLELTTVASCEDVAAHIGVDIRGKDFWKQSLDMYIGLVDEYEALVDTLKK